MEPVGVASSAVDRQACSFVDTGTGGCASFLNVGTVSVPGPPHPTSMLPSLRPPSPKNHRRDGECEIFEGHCALCGKSLARINIFFYNDSRFCSLACRMRRCQMDEEAAAAAVEERLTRGRGFCGFANDGYSASLLRRLDETTERLWKDLEEHMLCYKKFC